ncbi:hypothetical protein DV452_002616 [Geotrichum candidum]|nr:hypothetical protein DV452_002616 [Geotrichum candidum]KAI8133510.1 hypothetical protein DUD61_002861 [Geotrichum candidum]KAI9212699.1 hypothetical protein DS838_002437 [Geotrichum bryndzae]
MGNTPSKNAPVNTSVTPAASSSASSVLAASAEDSDDPGSSGCSGLSRSNHHHQQQQQQQQKSTHHHNNSVSIPIRVTPASSQPSSSPVRSHGTPRHDSASLSSATSVSSSVLSSVSTTSTDSSVSRLSASFVSTTISEVPAGSAESSESAPKSSKKATKQPASVDINDLIQRLIAVGLSGSSSKRLCLTNSEIIGVCRAARSIFLAQPTLLELGTPVKVVGDIHGQFGDLMRIFQLCGIPPTANYLFLGDYVDRGKQSIETFLLLLCFKIRYPENVFLLRGNHECASVTKVYGFYDECKRRTSTRVWKSFVDVFNTLPIAATIGGKIFCVHGGLSPYLNSLDDIRNIQRPTDIPEIGLLSDMLWSDPDNTMSDWGPNDRGVSYCFGRTVVDGFCAKFGFDLIVRGHMVVEDGYEFFDKRKLVTVFSAPNYCGEFGNWAAVMAVSPDLLCSFELLKPLDTIGVKKALRNVRADSLVSKISSTPASASNFTRQPSRSR